MRRELMRCFDDIYILDLHGNNRKKETAPDGSKDENVFDIMQGVSINIFVKKKNSSDKPAIVHHCDVYGLRKYKEAFLSANTLSSIKWQIVQTLEPNVFFVPKDFSAREEYERGFKVDELMKVNSSGIKTHHDGELVSFEPFDSKFNKEFFYRPFDNRFINYDIKKVVRHRYDKMRHLLHDNISIITSKQQTANPFSHIMVSTYISDNNSISISGGEASYVFPLYLYPSESELGFDTDPKPNLDYTIWCKIENWVKYGQEYKPLTANEQAGELGFDAAPEEPHFLLPEDIFDYIYGVLHSPLYREKYKEFLKVDFPRIPYPKNADEFEHYRDCGHQLRELHLMRNMPKPKVNFEGQGDFEVKKVSWENERVYINDTQYFSKVPQVAWEFFIGGYQPAQKWLKDRKDRALSYKDVEHYRKIISVLLETKRIMDSMDDPAAQLEEYKHKVQSLEHQLHEKEQQTVVNNIHIDTFNNYQDDHSQHLTVEK